MYSCIVIIIALRSRYHLSMGVWKFWNFRLLMTQNSFDHVKISHAGAPRDACAVSMFLTKKICLQRLGASVWLLKCISKISLSGEPNAVIRSSGPKTMHISLDLTQIHSSGHDTICDRAPTILIIILCRSVRRSISLTTCGGGFTIWVWFPMTLSSRWRALGPPEVSHRLFRRRHPRRSWSFPPRVRWRWSLILLPQMGALTVEFREVRSDGRVHMNAFAEQLKRRAMTSARGIPSLPVPQGGGCPSACR